MVTVRVRSLSMSDASAFDTACHPCSQKASISACVACRGKNSVSRSRHGFSPSVSRKSVKRDLRFPLMCQAIVAREFPEIPHDLAELLLRHLTHGRFGQLLVAPELDFD